VRYQVPDKAAHAYSALFYHSVMHTLAHIINQTPPSLGSAMGLFTKGLSAWVQSRLDPCPKEQNRTDLDLDIQTHPSEGPNTSCLQIWCKSVHQFPRYLIHKQKRTTKQKVTNIAKNRTFFACGKTTE